MVLAAGLRVHGMTVMVGGQALPTGELTVFCRPVVTVPAVVRRDGTVLADAWLPDLVRLGGLEANLGDGMIEPVVDVAVAAGRLKPPGVLWLHRDRGRFRPVPAAGTRTHAESTAGVPARQRHQDNRHRQTPGHHVRARLLLTPAPGPAAGRRNPPRPAGTRGP